MARGFNIVAQLQIQGPTNLGQIRSNIQNAFNSQVFQININPTASSISNLRRSINQSLSLYPFKISIDVSNASLRAAIVKIGNTLNGLQNRNIQVQIQVNARGLTQNTINRLNQLDQIARRLSVSLRAATISAGGFANVLSSISRIVSGSAGNMATFASSIRAIASGLNQIQRQASQTQHSLEDFGRQSALAIRRFLAFSIPTGILFGLGSAFVKGTKEALSFQDQLVRISQVTGTSLSGLKELVDEVTRLSTGFGVSSKDLLESSETLAQAGLPIKEVKTALDALAKTTLAPTFKDAKNTVEGMIAAMAQFKIPASELEREFGAINAVSAAFAVESDDIVTAIRRTGGAFKSAGGNLRELTALFTSVRSTTRESAETIATGFRTIFTRLQRGSTIEFLKTLGIELTDAKGRFVGAYEAISRLSSVLGKLAGSGDVRFSQVIEELGGFRQVEKVIPLLTQFSTAQRALAVAEGGVGSLARDAALRQQSLEVQLRKVKEEFLDLFRVISNNTSFRAFIKLVTDLSTALIGLAKSATDALPAITVASLPFLARSSVRFGSGFFGFGNNRTVQQNRNQPPPPNTGFPATLIASVVSGIAVAAVNSHLNSEINKLDKTRDEAKVTSLSGGKGAFAGGVAGGLIGLQSGLGLPGIIGGAAIGALAGFVTSVNAAAQAIKEAKIEVALSSVSKSLEEFATNTRAITGSNLSDFQKTLADSTSKIIQESLTLTDYEKRSVTFKGIDPILGSIEQFFTGKPGEQRLSDFTKARQSVEQEIPNLRILSEKTIRSIISKGNITDVKESGNVLQQFLRNNGGLGNTIVQRLGFASQTSTDKILKQFEEAVPKLIEENKDRDNLIKSFKAFNDAQLKVQNEMNKFSGAIIGASVAVQKFDTSIALIESFLSGTLQTPKIQNTSEIFKNFEKVGESAFKEAVNTFSFITGDAGKQLADTALEAKRAIDVVPTILKSVASKGISDRGSLEAEVSDSLRNKGFSETSPVTLAVKNLVNELENGTNEVKAIDKIRDDSKEVFGKLIESLKQFIEPLDEVNKIFIDKVNEFNSGISKLVGSITARDREFEKIGELTTQRELLLAKFEQRPINPEVLTNQFNDNQKFLGGNIGLNPQALALRIGDLQSQIEQEIVKQANFTIGAKPEDIKQSTAKLLDMNVELARAKQALSNLTDVTKRTAGLEEKRNQLVNRRQAFGNFTEDFVFGNSGQKFESLRNLNSTNAALKFGLQAVPQNNLGGVRSVLKAFGNINLPGFGGQTGNQALQELVFKQLQPVGQKLGLNENQIRELAGQLTEDEKDVINKIVEASTEAIKAQGLIVDNLKTLQNEFFVKLQTSFDRFLNEFGKNQIAKNKFNLEQQIEESKTGRLGFRKNKEFIINKAQELGLPTNDFSDIRNLSKDETLNTIIKIRGLSGDLSAINKVINNKPNLAGGDANETFNKILNSGLTKSSFKNFDELQKSIIEEFGRILDEGTFSTDPKVITPAERTKRVNDIISKQLTGENDIRGDIGKRILEEKFKLNDLTGRGSAANITAIDFAHNNASLDSIRQLGEAIGKFENVGQITTEINKLTLEINALGEVVNKVNQQFGDINAKPVDIPANPIKRNFGGFVYGKPGIDTNPAFLTSGEFVVRKQAAEKNKELLEVINNAREPLAFARGGQVTFNNFNPYQLERILQFEKRRRNSKVNLGNLRGMFAQGKPDINKGVLAGNDNANREVSNDALVNNIRNSLPINLLTKDELEYLAESGNKKAISRLKTLDTASPKTLEELKELRYRAVLSRAISIRNRTPKNQRNNVNTLISKAQDFLQQRNEKRKRKDVVNTEVIGETFNFGPKFPKPAKVDDKFGYDFEKNGNYYTNDLNRNYPSIVDDLTRQSENDQLKDRIERYKKPIDYDKDVEGFRVNLKPAQEIFDDAETLRVNISPGPSDELRRISRENLEKRRKALGLDTVEPTQRQIDRVPLGVPYFADGGQVEDNNFYDKLGRKFPRTRKHRLSLNARLLSREPMYGFNKGGVVPGVGSSDSVLSALTPGEVVIPKQIVQHFANGGTVGQSGGSSDFGLDFSKVISSFNQFNSEFHTNINSFGSFVNKFGEFVNKIPHDITMTGNHNLNVVINGAEAINSLQSSLRELVSNQINAAINNLIKTKFPEKLVAS